MKKGKGHRGSEAPEEGNSVEAAADAGQHAWVRGHNADGSLGRWTTDGGGGGCRGGADRGFFFPPLLGDCRALVQRDCGEGVRVREGSSRGGAFLWRDGTCCGLRSFERRWTGRIERGT